jgi:hypothetical protein
MEVSPEYVNKLKTSCLRNKAATTPPENPPPIALAYNFSLDVTVPGILLLRAKPLTDQNVVPSVKHCSPDTVAKSIGVEERMIPAVPPMMPPVRPSVSSAG